MRSLNSACVPHLEMQRVSHSLCKVPKGSAQRFGSFLPDLPPSPQFLKPEARGQGHSTRYLNECLWNILDVALPSSSSRWEGLLDRKGGHPAGPSRRGSGPTEGRSRAPAPLGSPDLLAQVSSGVSPLTWPKRNPPTFPRKPRLPRVFRTEVALPGRPAWRREVTPRCSPGTHTQPPGPPGGHPHLRPDPLYLSPGQLPTRQPTVHSGMNHGFTLSRPRLPLARSQNKREF